MLERLDERELLLESVNFCRTKQERYINYFFKLPVLLKYTQSSLCYICTSTNYNY